MQIKNPFQRVGKQKITADCLVTDSLGDWVYIASDQVAGVYQVTKIDVEDENKMPAVGVIVKKLEDTKCVVQCWGEVKSLFAGLEPGKSYMISGSSSVTNTTPIPPFGGYLCVQKIGMALSATSLLMFPGEIIKRVG